MGGAPRSSRCFAAEIASVNAPNMPWSTPCRPTPCPAQSSSLTGKPTNSTFCQPSATVRSSERTPAMLLTTTPLETISPSIEGAANVTTMLFPTEIEAIATMLLSHGLPTNA